MSKEWKSKIPFGGGVYGAGGGGGGYGASGTSIISKYYLCLPNST